MQHVKHTNKHLFRLSGLVVVFCIIAAAVVFNCNRALSMRAKVLSATSDHTTSATFNTASTTRLSLASNKHSCNFSIRSKNTVKQIIEKGAYYIAGHTRLLFTKIAISNALSTYPTLPVPGYYLFLFRYALF